jgi:carbonic anhydrase
MENLFVNNRKWAAKQLEDDPEYFNKLSKLQTPEFLWIGCSDSRVPANQITGTMPGEVFVHRNVANLVPEDDLNLLSVLHFAVNYLKVKHIIVCGHYGCGGIKAALSDDSFGILDKWLINIKKVYQDNKEMLDAISDPSEKEDRLTELNVEQQVRNLINTSIIQEAWEKEQRPFVHGWVFGLKDGILKPLFEVDPSGKGEW